MKLLQQPLYNWYRQILQNSKYRWIVIFGSLLYLISPLDLVTDFLPVVGWIDDGLIATLLVAEVSQVVLEQLKTRKFKSSNPETISA